jgi:IS5 family transposase
MTIYFRKRLPEAVMSNCNGRIVYHRLKVIRSPYSQDPDGDYGSGGGSNNPEAQPQPYSEKQQNRIHFWSMAPVPYRYARYKRSITAQC